MKAITNFRFFARKFGTSSKLVVRQATLRDADIITRRTIQEVWHIGPYDFRHYNKLFLLIPKVFSLEK